MKALAFLLLLVATLATAISVVHAKHRHRLAFVELTQLEAERDELNIEFGRLQLEQATWAETTRVEQIARGQLKMEFPTPDRIVVVKP